MDEHLRGSQPSNMNADINKRCGLSVLLLEGKYHEGSLPPNYSSSFSVTSGQCLTSIRGKLNKNCANVELKMKYLKITEHHFEKEGKTSLRPMKYALMTEKQLQQ